MHFLILSSISLGRLLSVYKCSADFNTNNNVSSVDTTLADNADVIVDEMITSSVHAVSAPVALEDRFAKYLTHPVKISHLDLDGASTNANISNDLIATYKATLPAPLAAKLRNLMYFKADIEITFAVQGQAQACGQIVYAFDPYLKTPTEHQGNTVSGRTASPLGNAKILPHVVIDPSKTATYKIVLPVCTPSGFYSFADRYSYGSYGLNQWVYNALRTGTAVAPTVNVCIYMSLINPQFDGLTSVTMAGPDFVDEKGYLSATAMAAANVASSIGQNFPSLSPLTTLFSSVAGTAGNVLRLLGFSKPPVANFPPVSLVRTCEAYSQKDGHFNAIVLSGSQTSGVSIDPAYGCGSLEDMSIDALCRKPMPIILDYTITAAAAKEALLFSFPVCPNSALRSGTGPNYDFSMGPISGLAMVHRWWAGDLDFTFEFVASIFHRSTVLIAWEPHQDVAAPSFADALVALNNTTVNITGNTTVKVKIPYKQPFPLLSSNLYPNEPQTIPPYYNGSIHVYLINPVKSNGSTDPIGVNVYMSSDNIKFVAPVPSPLAALSVTMAGPDFVTEETSVVFGKPTDLSKIGFACSPDVSRSVKDVTSRLTAYYTSAPVSGSKSYFTEGQNIIQLKSNLTTNVQNTLASFIGSGYLGIRGSNNYSYLYEPNDGSPTEPLKFGGQMTHRAGHHIHRGYVNAVTATASSEPAAATLTEDSYSWTEPNLNVTSRVDAIVPGMVPWNYVSVRAAYSLLSDAFVFLSQSNVNTTGVAEICAAHGDDVVYCWFLGFPKYTYTP